MNSVLLVEEDEVIDELYDLIGGRETIWAATESFYRRVFADDTLRPFFKSTDMAQLSARQSMFLSNGHFDRFLSHFRESLNEVGVQADKVEKVTKLLESKRNTVLNR
ncbi:MAG: hypothetical protein DMG10_29295 [Acidobacteria bacterium]|nr:MAG: hypothetical protein DMG10_29295 [Acidobacteriota bacterium]